MPIRTTLTVGTLVVALASLAWSQARQSERIYFQLPEMAALNLPFSDAVMVDNTLYLSGNGGLDIATMTVPDDPKDEARLLMENFRRTLALADMTLDDLVSVTVYCPDLSLYADFNEVYRSYFEDEFPARAFIGSAPLLFGMRFEMQAITLAFPAPPAAHEDDEVAEAMGTILGGENSRFYWEIIQRGIAPRVGAFRFDYEDCGLMVLAGLCPPENAEQLTEAMQTEADKITRQGVNAAETQRVKTRRRTTLAQEAETPYLRLAQLRDDVEHYGRPRTVEERLGVAVRTLGGQPLPVDAGSAVMVNR